MITTPWTRADCAIAGYVGLTSFVLVGGRMLPPTRTGAGGGGGAATNAVMTGGVGRTSAAISGMMMTAPMITVCVAIDSGTVYHFFEPILIDGSTTSPNMSRGTDCLLQKRARRNDGFYPRKAA